MKNFKSRDGARGSRGEGRGGFAYQERGRAGDREIKMFKAQCSECKKGCDVPFKPNGEKPVFCRDCFSAKRGADDRGSRSNKEPYQANRFSNDKRDERGAPFVRTESVPSKVVFDDSIKKQLTEISLKLDRLISAIEEMSAGKRDVLSIVKADRQVTIAKSGVDMSVQSVMKKVVPVKKVAPKKVIVKKSIPAKKVVTKKVVLKKTSVKKTTKKTTQKAK